VAGPTAFKCRTLKVKVFLVILNTQQAHRDAYHKKRRNVCTDFNEKTFTWKWEYVRIDSMGISYAFSSLFPFFLVCVSPVLRRK
jgi:hypothetical protein